MLKIPQFSSKINGSLIPDSGNHKRISCGFANKSKRTVPTKNEGNEYNINSIKEIPLSVFESLLIAEYIPNGRLIKYAINIDSKERVKDIPTLFHIFLFIGWESLYETPKSPLIIPFLSVF